jgi:ferric-dicitrate binding protein FerR (iron transport regulator)
LNNEHEHKSSKQNADAEQVLEQLLTHAQPRPMPPAADTEEIRRVLYAEWDAVTGQRVWLRRAAALAATVAAAAVVFWASIGVNPPPTLPTLANVERVQAVIGIRSGDALQVGSVVATGSGQLALRLASGGSLRLGRDTRLELTGANTAVLTAGQLYFDSEGSRAAEAFTVTTPLGTVRDVGTQFMVRIDPQSLEVGVRAGRVALTRDAEQSEAAAGDKLSVAAASPGIRRDAIATFGEEWAWAEQVAPVFDIDGRVLRGFLGWFEPQTGRAVVFADPAAERVARETILNGSIDLEPLPKLAAVLTLTDLDYTLDGARVVIATR